jgi:hypothetical protein
MKVAMKFFACLNFFLIFVTSVAFGALAQYPVTKKTVCFEGNTCIGYCDYNGVNVLPGGIYKEKNTCTSLYCRADFSMTLMRFVRGS